MKFAKPRVFEYEADGTVWRVAFAHTGQKSRSIGIIGGKITNGVDWSCSEVLYWIDNPNRDHRFREVRKAAKPPFDITKLDTAGVFHEVPEAKSKAGEPLKLGGNPLKSRLLRWWRKEG